MARPGIISAVDIGTSKTACAIAEVTDRDQLVIIGFAQVPSEGIQKGVVVDIGSAADAIHTVTSRAAQQAGREVGPVLASVTGQHISSVNSRGATAITSPRHEISREDVERARQQSKIIVIPPDRMILHALPRSFTVDGQQGVQQPIGMSGSRLEVDTHIVTGSQTFLENLDKSVHRAGVSMEAMVLAPIASSLAVTNAAERNLGVCVIDIGAGTTDLALYKEGEIVFTSSIPMGGNHVTGDIAQLLRVTTEDAEALKVDYGSARPSQINEIDTVPVNQIGRDETRRLRRAALSEIIAARMQELCLLAANDINKSGCHDNMGAGIILTGGTSGLPGLGDCANECLKQPVRVARPSNFLGLSEGLHTSQGATLAGLLHYGLQIRIRNRGAAVHAGTPQVSRAVSWIRDRLGGR